MDKCQSLEILNHFERPAKENSAIDFDLVSFTSLITEKELLQLEPYLNKENPGYRPMMSRIVIGPNGYNRMRLAHDASAFLSMHS